jgi:hypothetical protein
MRIHEGNFAYDIEPIMDPSTRLRTGWRYRVFAMRPERELLRGEEKTREEAEQKATQEIENVRKNPAKSAA